MVSRQSLAQNRAQAGPRTAHHVHMVAVVWDPGMRHPILRPTSSQEAAGSLNSQAQCRAPPQSHSPNNEGGGFALDHSIHRDRPPQCTYSKGSSPRSPGRPKDSTPGAHLGCHLGSTHEMPHPKTHQVSVKFVFFFKIYFIFIGKADIQRGETERKIFHPIIHSPGDCIGRYYGGPKPGASSESPIVFKGPARLRSG